MTDIKSIMALEVPFVVVLGERPQLINSIRNWIPGSIIELAKVAEEDLDIRINNRPIGQGSAVKVGENFGVKINFIGDPIERINAMGPGAEQGSAEDIDAEAMAMALLDGQI